MTEDPVVGWLLRYPTRLKAGGLPSPHEVLATYWLSGGRASFAFCRHGLLIDPSGDGRYIPFVEIEDSGYHNREVIERAKRARTGDGPVDLPIRLRSGESLRLVLERHGDKIQDILAIARLVHRRVVIHRAEKLRATLG